MSCFGNFWHFGADWQDSPKTHFSVFLFPFVFQFPEHSSLHEALRSISEVFQAQINEIFASSQSLRPSFIFRFWFFSQHLPIIFGERVVYHWQFWVHVSVRLLVLPMLNFHQGVWYCVLEQHRAWLWVNWVWRKTE